MKEYLTTDIRNSAIVGHASSGKTMLSECLLACAGAINRLGRIENGSTVSDYHEAEHERKNSIYPSMMFCEWQGRKLNVMDTPGYLDFTAEPLGVLRVADNAIVVVHAKDGVLVGTNKVWEYATQYGVPKMIVVNGLDREQVEFERVLAQVREIDPASRNWRRRRLRRKLAARSLAARLAEERMPGRCWPRSWTAGSKEAAIQNPAGPSPG